MPVESIRIEGLEGVLDMLKQLPPEIVSKAGGPVKFGVMAGAQLLRDEAKLNVRRIIDTPNDSGENESTGLLLLSIQAKRSKPTGNAKGEAAVIGVRRNQKYPANRQNKAGNLTAVQIGRQLEYGTERREPMPWMRPAFDSKKTAAVNKTVDEIKRRTQIVIDRLARKARRK